MRPPQIKREQYFTNPNITEQIMKNYLKSYNLDKHNSLWLLKYTGEAGRGLFATQDLPAGTVVCMDYPLIFGPRLTALTDSFCTVCYRQTMNLQMCGNKCGLPLCSNECENSQEHQHDCEIITKWIEENKLPGFTEWCKEIFRSLTAIRSLNLTSDKEEVLFALQGHSGDQHGLEIKLLKKVGVTLTVDEEEYIRDVCCILDTNAFEMIVDNNEETKVSLRAVYPVAALMNHSCIPNTTHLFDSNKCMVVKTTRLIKADEEITTTYTKLLWGTVARRYNLYLTKNFWCKCKRCMDLSEFGCSLSALYCTETDCLGYLMPTNILDIKSCWECNQCKKNISVKKIGIIQATLGNIVKSISPSNVDEFLDFLQNKLVRAIPPCNQIIVEYKIRAIGLLGFTPGYFWNELSDHLLNYKEELCRELLHLIDQLGLGYFKMKGFLSQELFLTLKEKCKRNNLSMDNREEMKNLRTIAVEILENDLRLCQEDLELVS